MATVFQGILTILGSIFVTSIISVLIALGILELRLWRMKKKVNQEIFDGLKKNEEKLTDKIRQEIAKEVKNGEERIQKQEERREIFRQRKNGKRKYSLKELPERRRTKETLSGRQRIQIPISSKVRESKHNPKRDWASFK